MAQSRATKATISSRVHVPTPVASYTATRAMKLSRHQIRTTSLMVENTEYFVRRPMIIRATSAVIVVLSKASNVVKLMDYLVVYDFESCLCSESRRRDYEQFSIGEVVPSSKCKPTSCANRLLGKTFGHEDTIGAPSDYKKDK